MGAASATAGRVIPPDPTRTARRSLDRLWLTVVAVVMAVGLAGSAVAGWAWASYQATQLARQFTARAGTEAASVTTGIERDLDFQHELGQYIATTPGVTNARLGPWLTSLHLSELYPGTLGFSFVEKVSASRLASFLTSRATDPIVGMTQTPYSVFPTGARSSYCLPRYGIVTGTEPAMMMNTDMCAPVLPGLGASPTAALLDRAASSAEPQLEGFSSFVPPNSPAADYYAAGLAAGWSTDFLAVTPVYAGGSTPPTAAARNAAVVGWVVGSFTGTTLLDGTRASDLAVALSGPDGQVTAGGGLAPHQVGMRRTFAVPVSPGLEMSVSGPRSSAPTVEGLLLGLLAGALTALVCAFGFHLARSRARALRLVDQRTGELRHQALHDALTGLPNRSLLLDRMEQMLSRARRNPLAVGALFVDLDNFKDVNDTFGHDVGDLLLRAVAERLGAAIRQSDTVGRLGGDEFLVLTEDDALDAGPEMVAARIVDVLSAPFELLTPEPVTLTIKPSVGVAVGVRDSANELIRDADVALYQAKEDGKGRYVVFRPEMQMAVQDRLILEMDLRRAVGRGELFVEYQPIFDLTEMTTTGVEALARWRHAERGLVPPAEFIPVAEQAGLIGEVGSFVLDEACRQAGEWARAGHELNMSVNVSVIQLEDRGFVDGVRQALARHGVPPETLTLELTESVLTRNFEATAAVLTRLKELGVRIAIDDFGTGYSSLAYLRRFPIDSLKIDRSFVSRSTQGGQSDAIMRTLVQLGLALGIETLAEGIEDEAQLARLRKERCDRGQGFLFARPLPAGEVPAFLHRAGPAHRRGPAAAARPGAPV